MGAHTMTYGLESSPGLRLDPLPDMENEQFELRRRRQRSPQVVALTQRSSLTSTGRWMFGGEYSS